MNAAYEEQETEVAPGRRRLIALAFVDVVGYSILMATNEASTHARWMQIMSEVLRPKAHEHFGRIVKSTGDGVLAEFPSALDAVEWAQEIQLLVSESQRVAEPGAAQLALRVAVHLGDVVEAEADIYGDAVNIAARLQEHASPGGVVLSGAVYDAVRGRTAERAQPLGLLTLKNFVRPVQAYALDPIIDVWPIVPWKRSQTAPSIAILPLRNISRDPDDEHFGAGIIEDIVVSLASLRELVVIARESTLRYAQAEADPRVVGAALGVRYVMSGSVRRGRQALRISVQLWDAESSANLWAFSAEVPVEKIFDTQDEIVIKIVGGIAPHVRLAELQAALRKRPASFTAYDHLLRALSLMNRLEVGSFMEARSFLERATTADPRFAAALAWTARWYSILAGQGWSSEPDEDRERGAAFAAQAIEIDPDNSLALAVYGHLKSFLFHDYESAQVYLARALMASPSNSLAWILSSATLSYIGRSEEAIRHAEHALRLSPFDPALFSYYMFLGIAHYAHGNYDEAVKWGRMSISENPRYTSTLKLLAASLSAQGRILEARTAGEQLLSFEPGFRLATYAARQPFRDLHVKASYLGHLLAAGLPE